MDAMMGLQSFIDNWKETPEQNRQTFIRLKNHLETLPEISLDFLPREGVTYSLRASHRNQAARPLFVMVDVIEDDPRWLSVCFYGDLITDPDEKGDFVPEGLLGEDAICFDLEAFDETDVRYVEDRMVEAHRQAANA
ncbi:MAG: hypothetical protein ACOWWM_05090 [Desulfobacterales bacterium]